MDEFTDSAEGSVVFSPKLSADELREIEEKTRSADVPTAIRYAKSTQPTSELNSSLNAQESPTLKISSDAVNLSDPSKITSPAANLEPAKISEQTRSNIGFKSEQVSEHADSISDLYRSKVGAISEQKTASPLSIPNLDQTVSEQYRSNVGAISEQTTNASVIKSEQSRSSIGAENSPQVTKEVPRKSKAYSVPSPTSVSDLYRRDIGGVSEQTRSIGVFQEQSRIESGVGTGAISEQELIFILPPLDRKIVCFFASLCAKKASLQTPPLTYEQIAGACETSGETAKTQVKRLEKRGVIKRAMQKRGPGSWTVFELPKNVYDACLHFNSIGNHFEDYSQIRPQNHKSIGAGIGASKGVEAPSSSSFINNKETTTKRDHELGNIQVPEILVESGFTKGTITQLLNQTEWSVDEIQSFLIHFAFDLPNKSNIGNPVAFFMKIVKVDKIAYESEALIAQEERAIADYKSRQARKLELLRDEKMLALSKKFEEYYTSLSDSQRDEIVNPNWLVKTGSKEQRNLIWNRYLEADGDPDKITLDQGV